MPELVPHRRIHVVGAGGAGMSGLAKILAQAGHTVTGSDLKPAASLSSLAAAGVETWVGHRPAAASSWDLVVASSAVPDRDPEVQAAREAGVAVWGRPRLLEALTKKMGTIGVTGTHGKTSGTAMLVTALRSLGRDPSFMVGGELVGVGTNAHLGETGLFALEADEAFGTFLSLDLTGLVVTNVEPDHLDHYGSLEDLESAFVEVVGSVDGPVVACLDDPGAAGVARRAENVTGYGTSRDSPWRITGIGHRPGGVSFRLTWPHGEVDVDVPKPGVHVARNASGVLALLGEMGFDVAGAAAGLSRFAGVRRRFETRARIDGVVVIDDYAIHPTEIRATIEAARLGGAARTVAVFQPHRFTRTAEMGAELGEALAGAKRVFVTDVYAASEAPIPGVTGRVVAAAADAAGAEVTYVPRRADLAAAVAAEARAGDLILLMGAGDITLVADELPPLLAGDG
ncbi:MAG TPA: UDP-N-acetylmuramate--L-alanine ligase [Acidimicrobiia bacterium]|nr:UDP-N-acetylmuramate--L-alanine ligase [Acidimicrobiia bacterium]